MSILTVGKDERPFVTSIRIPSEDRNRINRDVEQFLANGGKIQQIPTGMSAEAYSITTGSNGRPVYEGLDGREHWRSQRVGKAAKELK